MMHLSSHFSGDGGRDHLLNGNLFCEVSWGATVSVDVIKSCVLFYTGHKTTYPPYFIVSMGKITEVFQFGLSSLSLLIISLMFPDFFQPALCRG